MNNSSKHGIVYYIITIQLVRQSLKPAKKAAHGQSMDGYKKYGIINISIGCLFVSIHAMAIFYVIFIPNFTLKILHTECFVCAGIQKSAVRKSPRLKSSLNAKSAYGLYKIIVSYYNLQYWICPL